MTPRDRAAEWISRVGVGVLPLVGRAAVHGPAEASRDLERFNWDHPDVDGAGAVPGTAGCVVLDVDRHKGAPDGFESLGALEGERGEIPRDAALPTPSEGLHIWLRKPDPAQRVGGADLAPGINVKGDVGYVKLRHPPPEVIPEAPAWLTSMLAPPGPQVTEPVEPPEPQYAPAAEWHPRVSEVHAELAGGAIEHHDTALPHLMRLVRLEAEGLAGATSAIEELREPYLDVERHSSGDWERMIAGARAKVADTPSTMITEKRRAEGEAFMAELERRLGSAATEDFWAERPILAHIHQTARARLMAPWATLGVVLARLATAVPPYVVLPTFGRRGCVPLNAFVGLVGDSGRGKDGAIAAGSDAIGIEHVYWAGVGSGEGLAHQYLRWDKGAQRFEQYRSSVLFKASEVDTLVALGKHRRGSTLLPELRNAWSGERLGHAYADRTKRLDLPEHRYRLCLIVGIQPERAAPLLADADAGTPQRFLWFPVTEPEAPEVEPEEPEALHWEKPTWPEADTVLLRSGVNVSRMSVPEQISGELKAARRRVLRGAGDPLEGHRLQVQLRTAGLLAILDGRTSIDTDDWRLAGVVQAVSDETRNACAAVVADQTYRGHRKRGEAAAIADEARDERATKRVARTVKRQLDVEWERWSVVRRRLTSRDRDYFEAAVAALADAGQIEVRDSKRGRELRYVE